MPYTKGVVNGTSSSLADACIERVVLGRSRKVSICPVNGHLLCCKIAYELILSVKNNKCCSIRLPYLYLAFKLLSKRTASLGIASLGHPASLTFFFILVTETINF